MNSNFEPKTQIWLKFWLIFQIELNSFNLNVKIPLGLLINEKSICFWWWSRSSNADTIRDGLWSQATGRRSRSVTRKTAHKVMYTTKGNEEKARALWHIPRVRLLDRHLFLTALRSMARQSQVETASHWWNFHLFSDFAVQKPHRTAPEEPSRPPLSGI